MDVVILSNFFLENEDLLDNADCGCCCGDECEFVVEGCCCCCCCWYIVLDNLPKIRWRNDFSFTEKSVVAELGLLLVL